MRKRLFLIARIVFVVVSLAALGLLSRNRLTPMPDKPLAPVTTPNIITREGEVVCLPHKTTTGPQTMECAFGLKASDGQYYALRDNTNAAPIYQAGSRFRVTGSFSAHTNSNYQDVGLITISSMEKL